MERRDDIHRLRVRALALAIVLAVSLVTQAVWAPAHAVSTSIPPANQPVVGPDAVLERFARAYRMRSVAGVDAVLTSDYRFHEQGSTLSSFLSGNDREKEMGAVRGMLEGVRKDGVVVMPAADSVSLDMDGISQNFDPEHPDSLGYYRVLTVRKFNLRAVLPKGQALMTETRLNTFHVVRGDAAVLADGQPADPNTWYIRRWVSDVTAVISALRDRGEPCGEPDPAAPDATPAANSPSVPIALALRPLLNPACALLTMTCDLPGNESAKIEVYDVSGRRVHQREVPVANAGVVTIDAGKGARILPGVYWVRLSQAARKPSTRMVVVSR
jgi:hypothetical protein